MFFWALATSGFTSAFNCVALQMGLLGSVIASRKEGAHSLYAVWATGAFLVAKLVAYTLLGALLGAFGQSISLSEGVAGVVELLAGVYIVLAALAVLGVHPVLRYVLFQPPRFMSRWVTRTSKRGDLLTPAFLGFLTIFIPCGTTVAVEALALHHGDPVQGGLIMGIFTLGTMPVFLGFGGLTAFLGRRFGSKIDKASALIVLILGLWAVNGTLRELGLWNIPLG
ncbi:MAG: hypothetical protein A2700_01435 [Candidatus Blackburnbacteria bacterium RIFCSPHIGHO2_01_FULL_44_64]|uniref:Urease accessory protein UreH-like transmembrane domain-containing protein n=1 Tax=Candidatus Blackburnbacteria bacterium RIFCSPHIGHO2_02_FULL_44_20 TaxID=1797516 RepID=A0A1G1V9R7_9BACT|nr:MAG: hypothetical protein A2700_01435 [Candidatus Blackburnbacteria bacterium RIFCSPHIGHO2_01_FULL_44_64]OGY12204.1 MAG: hypothetical protein A3D26_01315 [Candidatus Blackburnbacteria bacterium RIFCSPHIGHO2_02_FULL_44_20]